MFGIEDFSYFVIAAIIFTITPGIDTIFILNKSVSQGRRPAIYASFGVMSGVFVHILLATFGLSNILAQSAMLFSIVKYIGAGYLFYLGIKSILSKVNPLELDFDAEPTSEAKLKNFQDGLLTNLFNPKVALFFLSFFPQFIQKEAIDSFVPYMILGAVEIVIGLTWFMLISYFAGLFSVKFKENPKFNIWLNKISGVVFILMGIKIALSEK